MDGQTIYQRMSQVMADVGTIGKNQTNDFHRYQFRGIDDVMNALHGPLTKHGVFILPEVLEADMEWTQDRKGTPMRVASLRVAFHFCGADGDRVTAVAQGEAFANDDKAANKAMAAAFKYAMLQTFSVPTQDMGDADLSSPEVGNAPEVEWAPTGDVAQFRSSAKALDADGKKALKAEMSALKVSNPQLMKHEVTVEQLAALEGVLAVELGRMGEPFPMEETA